MKDKDVFKIVLEYMKSRYSHRDIVLHGDGIVSIDGDMKFNTDGYNAHYNILRLCNELKQELV